MSAPASPSDSPPPMAQSSGDSTRLRWWIHLLLIGAYPLVLGILGSWHRSARGPALTHSVRGLVIVCVVELLVFGIVFGLAWLASRVSRKDLLLRWPGGIGVLPLGIGYSIALRLALAVIVTIISGLLILAHLATPQSLQQFAGANRPDVGAIVDIEALRHDPLYFWLTMTLVSFGVAGFREELWRSACLAGMRALWPNRFGSRPGQFAAVAVAAVIFGFGHLAQGPLWVGGATLLGLGFGVIMVAHRSIWPAVIAHGMFDATSVALLPWLIERMPRAS